MEKTRLYYIDNLRVATIMSVIMIHLAVTYSGSGIWLYNEIRPLNFFNHIFFRFFQTFIQAFSMGMLFFVAGYFTHMAIDRKSSSQFVSDRFRRLGLPALFFLLFITPFAVWVQGSTLWEYEASGFLDFYSQYLQSAGMQLLGVGPMWFALALLIFSVIYVLGRLIFPQAANRDSRQGVLNASRLLLLIVIIAAVAFLLRLFFPIGSVFWGMQLGFFSQYIILFIAGIAVYRTNCLENITPAAGRYWLAAGLILGFLGLLLFIYLIDAYDFSTLTIKTLHSGKSDASGANWGAVYYALWESFVAVAMTVGLLGMFRDKLNFSNSLTQKLSAAAFAVYMFHPPIIVAVTKSMQALDMQPVFKWAMAGVISIPLCFLIGYYILLRIPLLKKIL
jgi:hypothetical protein